METNISATRFSGIGIVKECCLFNLAFASANTCCGVTAPCCSCERDWKNAVTSGLFTSVMGTKVSPQAFCILDQDNWNLVIHRSMSLLPRCKVMNCWKRYRNTFEAPFTKRGLK